MPSSREQAIAALECVIRWVYRWASSITGGAAVVEGCRAAIAALRAEAESELTRDDVLCQAHGAWNAECPGCMEEQRDEALAELEKLRAEAERKELEALRVEYKYNRIEIERLRDREQRLRDERTGNVWLWEDDEDNDLESLCCPILIQPEQLRALIAAEPEGSATDRDVERERNRGDFLAYVNDELRAKVEMYGVHRSYCKINLNANHDCNCGWGEFKRSLSAPAAEAPPEQDWDEFANWAPPLPEGTPVRMVAKRMPTSVPLSPALLRAFTTKEEQDAGKYAATSEAPPEPATGLSAEDARKVAMRIADEAHMRGRIYNAGGEKEKPGAVWQQLEALVDAEFAAQRAKGDTDAN